jgi:tRNA(Arg) A34 adenosine deaminase TadA
MTRFAPLMDAALDEARAAAARGETPVGAVLVDPATGAIVARAGNRTRELCDPTAHAEMLVIRAACAATGSERLPGLDLYVTLEPCAMCAAAIAAARLRLLCYGAGRSQVGRRRAGRAGLRASPGASCPADRGGGCGGRECRAAAGVLRGAAVSATAVVPSAGETG